MNQDSTSDVLEARTGPLGASVPAAAPVPGRGKRRRQIWIVVGLVAAVFVIGVALAALLGATAAERGPDGSIVEAGQLPSASLVPGDCLKAPGEEFAIVDAQVCAGEHELEVFHILDSTLTGAYPGRDAFVPEAQAACLPAFRAYVGVPAGESSLRIFTMTPSPESWAEGDRRLICAAFDAGSTLEGSIRDSGL